MNWNRRMAGALIVALWAGPAISALELSGFEVRAGAALPSDWDTGYTLGVAADLGEVWTDNLRLYPALSYQVAEDSASVFGVAFDLEVSSIALGAEVRYHLDEADRGWYFGGGPYVHFVDREFAVARQRPVAISEDSQEFGVAGVAGYRLPAGLLAEARYMVVTEFDQLQLLLGFSF